MAFHLKNKKKKTLILFTQKIICTKFDLNWFAGLVLEIAIISPWRRRTLHIGKIGFLSREDA
jgi:hypothetical protein